MTEASRSNEDNVTVIGMIEKQVIELPIEVEEYAIEFLDNVEDAGTIAHCALVCRGWLPICRSKLYYQVRLRYCRQWTAFERLISLSASSRIAGYLDRVRDVIIWPENRQQFKINGRGKGEKRLWSHLVLVRCAAYLAGLTRIEFNRLDWTQPQYVLSLPFPGTYRSLITLDLQHCTFRSVIQLHTLVTSFPTLSDLSLWDVKLLSPKSSHIPGGGHSMTHLKLYSYSDVVATTISRWLATALLVQNLTYLKWWPDNATEWNTISNAIGCNTISEATPQRPSLQELHCDIPHSWQANLGRFTCIKALRLRYYLWTLDEHIKSLIRVLSTVSSNQLEELHIELNHSADDVPSIESAFAALTHFKTLDHLLTGPKFTQLRHVVLNYEDVHIDIHTIMATQKTLSSPGDNVIPISGSGTSSQPDVPRDELLNTHADALVQQRMKEELKQLGVRGALEINLKVDLLDPLL